MAATHTHTDQFIITGLCNNDARVIRDVYKNYSPKIYNWIKQNNGTQVEAEDIFQEALMDIFTKAKSGNFTLTCPFDAFLFVIVRNKWLSQLKFNKKMVVTKDAEFLSNTSNNDMKDAEAVILNEKQHQLLVEKLNELQDGCKTLLELSWQGLSMEEVARKLNVTYGYARKKKSLCMAKLIDSLKANKHLILQ
jgi:RNA polymerase sigma factor (sigma-70 family)